jgi:hypothetical protein
MKDGCKGDGSCGKKESGECDGDCAHDHHDHGKTHDPSSGHGSSGGCCQTHEKIDIKSLGPQAVELAGMFEEINDHLVAALKTRKKIIEKLHVECKDQGVREKYDVVLNNCHPVLIQFVFGDQK